MVGTLKAHSPVIPVYLFSRRKCFTGAMPHATPFLRIDLLQDRPWRRGTESHRKSFSNASRKTMFLGKNIVVSSVFPWSFSTKQALLKVKAKRG